VDVSSDKYWYECPKFGADHDRSQHVNKGRRECSADIAQDSQFAIVWKPRRQAAFTDSETHVRIGAYGKDQGGAAGSCSREVGLKG
jgi:hypothetical protein